MNPPYVAIMAGGIGSRFWPASREHRPKQFLDILGSGQSLLQQTFDRFTRITDPERILIVTNVSYRQQILDQLPQLVPSNVLCEPSRNNTAPCIAYTAFRIDAMDAGAPMIIAPSDHVIEKEDSFLTACQIGVNFAETSGGLVTLGIQPTRPDTGYGYIEYEPEETAAGIFKVKAFREKPDEQTARDYLSRGGYVWNAGIFIWTSQAILDAFDQHAQQIYGTLAEGKDQYNTSSEQSFINAAYPNTDKISVDYAIMERAENVYTIPCDIGWSDLGTWGSLHAYASKDDQANVVQGGNTVVLDAKNNLIRTNDAKLVVIRGLEDFIVVDEEDVLMIYPKSQEQEIKALTQSLQEDRYK